MKNGLIYKVFDENSNEIDFEIDFIKNIFDKYKNKVEITKSDIECILNSLNKISYEETKHGVIGKSILKSVCFNNKKKEFNILIRNLSINKE